jgi:four helix bundle protein
MAVNKFEDLEIWQSARQLAKYVGEITMNGSLPKDFALKDQMRRSSGSIMDNIAEGFERNGNREFIQFLSIAKGSAGELRSQLYRAADLGHIDSRTLEAMLQSVIAISQQTSRLISYLQKTHFRGSKFVDNPRP